MYVHAPAPAQTQSIINDGRRISILNQISTICNSSEYKRLSSLAPNDDRMVAWRKELTRLNTELALLVSLQVPVVPVVSGTANVEEHTRNLQIADNTENDENDDNNDNITEEDTGEINDDVGELDELDELDDFE